MCICKIRHCFNVRSDLSADLEIVWLGICLPKTKPILLGMCYRPPKQNAFYEGLEIVLSNSNDSLLKEILLLGDFHIDVCKKNSPTHNVLLHFCRSLALTQIIKDHTRICETVQSTIDLIVVSDQSKISQWSNSL